MTSILVSTFKAKCVEILNTVHDGGESVVVTRRGNPLAKIVPVIENAPRTRELAVSPGEMAIRGDIVHGGVEEDWESLK